jgi:membrane-associated phospholipid phosphatase
LKQADPDGVFSAVRFQQYLAAAHLQGLTYLGTGISAFPSIHVAMATLFVLVAWPFGVVLRILSLAFLTVIFVGSVDLGWHYSVDGYASMIFTCAIYGSVGWLQRRFSRRAEAGARGRTQHPSQGSPIP